MHTSHGRYVVLHSIKDIILTNAYFLKVYYETTFQNPTRCFHVRTSHGRHVGFNGGLLLVTMLGQ
jgi:hypothetical protein